MKLTFPLTILLVAEFFSAGCDFAPSIQPLYTAQDSAFDSSLLGVWKPADGGGRMAITRLSGTKYHVFLEDNGTASFTAQLVEIGSARFVDCYPGDPGLSNTFYKAHLILGHTFGRVWLSGDDLKIGWLDSSWLATGLGSNALLDRITTEDQMIVSASTFDLRRFAANYSDTAAFGVTTEWKRTKQTP